MEAPPYGIKDEALRARVVAQMHSGDSAAAGLPGNPWWSIIELRRLSAHVRAHLHRLHMPLAWPSMPERTTSPTTLNAEDIATGAVHARVEVVLLDNCYHMITIDRERRTVIAKMHGFVARISIRVAEAKHGQ